MKNLLEKHSVKILYAATIAALGLSFLGSILNSHLLGDKMFGDWKYLQSFVTLVSYLVNFGLYTSGGRLIAATNDATKIRVYKGYLIYFALFGLAVITCSILITGLFIPSLLNDNLFHLALVLLPTFLVLPLGFYFEAAYQGEKKLLHLAAYRFIPPFLYVVLLYAFQGYSKGSIYYNASLYYGSFFLICALLIWNDKPIFKKNTSEWTDLKIQNKTFGLEIYWGSIWAVGIAYLLPILVGYLNVDHNNKDVGHYSLALSFVSTLTILPGIIGTSNYKEYITATHIPAQNFKKVIIASVVVLVALFLSIDFVVKTFLPPEFSDVAMLIKLGSFGAVIHGLGDFVNKFIMAKGESNYMKKVSIAIGIVQLVSSLILIKLFSSTGGIIARSLGSLVFFSAIFIYYYKKYQVGRAEGKKIIITQAQEA